MDSLFVVFVLIVLVLVTIVKGVRTVPQGSKWVVQRFGKYHCTLNPGLNLIIPYFDAVAFKVTTKDIVLDIPSQEVITKDNAVMIVNAVAYINIVQPEKAVYGVEDFRLAIQNLVQTSLRSIIGDLELDGALSSRDQIKARLKQAISDDISDWGITLKTVEIQDIRPSPGMQAAMEEQASAERQRRATVTRAEGSKTAAVLEAQGRLEASRQDAEAQIVLAQASQRAIEMVTSAVQDKELPVMYLLGERYIDAVKQLAASDNSKLVLVPGDIQASIRGVLGKVEVSPMRMLDIARLDAAPLGSDPCVHVHIPGFVRAAALKEINRDYPDIRERGNFPPEELSYGPAFAELLEELSSRDLKAAFERKFSLDLSENPLQLTARKYVDETDSGLHNDSRTKVVTVLIYFNETWQHAGGKLRLTRNEHDFDNYAVECEPKEGNLLAFVRSATSFHGYLPCNAERRSIQMYWVKSKREQRDLSRAGSFVKKLKRFLKRG